VKNSKQAATQLLEQSVYLLINNLETIVSSAVQGTAALFTTLRQVFTGNQQWIKNLIKFFTSKINAKQAEEEFINFVDRILQKISRQPALMHGTIIYSELVYDHYDELTTRKDKLLREKYPDQTTVRKIYSRTAVFLNLFLLVFSLVMVRSSTSSGPEAILLLFSVSWMIYQIFCSVSYFLSSRKREKLREQELKKYKDLLNHIKQK
jgi:hypothetical protein